MNEIKMRIAIKAGMFLFLLSLIITASAQAASFECSQSTTKVEKIICADAKLSKLDEELHRVYKEALKQSIEPEELEKRQKSWLNLFQIIRNHRFLPGLPA